MGTSWYEEDSLTRFTDTASISAWRAEGDRRFWFVGIYVSGGFSSVRVAVCDDFGNLVAVAS